MSSKSCDAAERLSTVLLMTSTFNTCYHLPARITMRIQGKLLCKMTNSDSLQVNTFRLLTKCMPAE